jgi:hypothetical protein
MHKDLGAAVWLWPACRRAVAETQRPLGVVDLRADPGTAVEGVDETTAEALTLPGVPIARVSDNGPVVRAQRLVSYRVSTTPPGNVRVSTRFRFTQLSSAVKNGHDEGGGRAANLHFARHLAPRGITVNTVAPGNTDNGNPRPQDP